MANKEVESIYQLSRQQLGMLSDALALPNSGIHVEQKIYMLRGDLDVPALRAAWAGLIQRHTVLRTAFVWKNQDEPVQVVLRQVELPFEEFDLGSLSEAEQELRISEYLKEQAQQGFVPAKAPLLRLALFRISPEESKLVWTHHHLIIDGWCRPIIDRELNILYEAFRSGRDARLPIARPFRDYIAWVKQQDLSAAENFWKRALAGVTGPTPIGAEQTVESVAEDGFANARAALSAAATTALKELARQHRLTVNTLIQGVWAVLLSRYSGHESVVFGTTVSGRPAELESVESMVGMFINTLPFKVNVADEALLSWMAKLQEQHLEMRNFEYCSSGQIHQWANIPGSAALYDSLIVFENYPRDKNPGASQPLFDVNNSYSVGARTGTMLNMLVAVGERIEFTLTYDRAAFDVSSIELILEHVQLLIDGMLEDPGQNVRALLKRVPDGSVPIVKRSAGLRPGAARADLMPPRNQTEAKLAAIWSAVLGIERIGVDENFFALRGHSLLALQVIARVREAFQVDLPLRAMFSSPTIAGFALQLDELRDEFSDEALSLQPAPKIVKRSGPLPVSFAQQRLWFLDQLESGSAFYNISRALRLTGPLDDTALERAVAEIIKRHESLRTAFVSDDGTPFQKIVEYESLASPIIERRSATSTEINELAAREARRSFDLSTGPLLRACLFRTGPDEHVLVLTMHHIAGDGWSLGVLFDELSKLYNAFRQGAPSPLAPLQLQYADYAAWQRERLRGEWLCELVSFWSGQLAGAPTKLALPTDRPRPSVQTFKGEHHAMSFSADLTLGLKSLSERQAATLFMTCLAGFELLLADFSGQTDFIVGTDVANRNRIETEALIGFFTNLLPLRARISPEQAFTELLEQVKGTTLDAYAHQELPFERLVEELRPERDLSRNPLAQVLLVMQNQPGRQPELDGLEVATVRLPLESSRFDLVLFLSEAETRLEGLWLYNPDLFEPATIKRLAETYEGLLQRIVATPNARVGAFLEISERGPALEKSSKSRIGLDQIRKRARKGVNLSQTVGVKTTFFESSPALPMILEPDGVEIDLPGWAGANRAYVDQLLLQHGALLWRGFDLKSVSEFESFAGAVCGELFGEYGDLPREQQGGKVYGSTPYPADERILFHNESSHMHQWPMLIWFYCVLPPQQGGESPIIDCRRIYQELLPEIRDRFERKGLLYVRNFTDSLDVSWQDFFHTTDRRAVEDYCRKASIDFEWKGDNGLRTRQIGPAVVKHPMTGEPAFFNQLQLHHIFCLAPAVRESLLSMMAEEDLPRNAYYGDGSRIESAVMAEIGALYDRLGVSFPWARHDVLMLNNMLVAHSRNPYVGERKIVVALGDLVRKGALRLQYPER